MLNLLKRKDRTHEKENVPVDAGMNGTENTENETISKAESETGVGKESAVEEKSDADKEHEKLLVRVLELFKAWVGENAEPNMREKLTASVDGALEASGSEESLSALFGLIAKGADYERAVAEALTEGEIKGRNSNITEQMELAFDSDGVPHPGVGGNIYNAPVPSIFELARDAH